MNITEKELIKRNIDKKNQTKSVIKKFYIYFVLLIIVILFSAVFTKTELFGRGNFLSIDNIINMLRMSVPIITLSGGFTLLMIAGSIDLSVGSEMSLSAVVFAYLILNGFSFLATFLIIVVLGILMGVINGYLVMKLRITPVIATLVTLNLYKGVARLMVPQGLLSIKSTATQAMPAWINDYGRKDVILGLPWAFIVAVVVIIALIIIQRKTIIGKYAAAIGGNRTAAELSGINAVKWVWIIFIIVGFLAALAGMARASYMSVGSPFGQRDGAKLHHRGAARRDCFYRRRRLRHKDDNRRADNNVRYDGTYDGYTRVLADVRDGLRADNRRGAESAARAGKSKGITIKGAVFSTGDNLLIGEKA